MSIFTPEELVSTQQDNVSSIFALANHALYHFQKLVELDLPAVKSALAEGEANWQETLSGNASEDFLTSQVNVAYRAPGR